MSPSLRLVSDQQTPSPLITKLRGYAALTIEEIASLEAAFGRPMPLKKGRDVILEGYESQNLYIGISGFASRYKLLATPVRNPVTSSTLPKMERAPTHSTNHSKKH